MAEVEKKPRSFRLSDEDFKALTDKFGSLTAALEFALKADTRSPSVEEEDEPDTAVVPRRGGRTPTSWPYPAQVRRWEELLLPVGDVVSTGYMDLWPINPVHMKTLERMFAPWAEAGFVLVWDDPVKEACTTVSTRLQPYFAGDRRVWCEFIGDPITGIEFIKTHTQVLVPMLADMYKLDTDTLYKVLYERYLAYYRYYFLSGKPYSD